MGPRGRIVATTATLATAVAATACLASSAVAEVVQKGGVRVAVSANLAPNALPRRGTAPVAVSLAGHITPTKPGALPKLQKISIALNSHGKLQNEGIPICRLGRIDPATTQEALAACRSSLIGEGHFSADVKIPEQSPFPSEGKVLAFNGKLNGSAVVFAQIYGIRPVPTSYVLSFLIGKTHGTYGTVLEASLPDVTGEWGYVTGVSLDLDRSFLAAGCPAPAGFPGAVFPLLKTNFGFEGGLDLSSTVTRNCKVKR